VILPRSYWDSYAEGSYESSFPGTGPFMVEDFTPGQGAVLVRNENYWGPTVIPDRVEVTFFADDSAMISAFQEGRLDVIPSFAAATGQALLNDPNIQIGVIETSEHRQVHMNTQEGLFADKRVRQALAFAINRQSMVDGLLASNGSLGNDHPSPRSTPVSTRRRGTEGRGPRHRQRPHRRSRSAGCGQSPSTPLPSRRSNCLRS
jgi:ABC-type transport system substrate-binding protein